MFASPMPFAYDSTFSSSGLRRLKQSAKADATTNATGIETL